MEPQIRTLGAHCAYEIQRGGVRNLRSWRIAACFPMSPSACNGSPHCKAPPNTLAGPPRRHQRRRAVPDVLSVSRYDGKVAWYANDGHGNFGTQHAVDVINFPTWIGTADIAGDGHRDIVVTSLNDNTVSWYHNDGHGNFGPRQVIANNLSQPYSATIADINGDGHLDVVVAYRAQGTDRVMLYENNGTGTTWTPITVGTCLGASNVSVSDMDKDGDLDILASGRADTSIYWFESNLKQRLSPSDPITFTRHTINPLDPILNTPNYGGGQASGGGIIAADINGDGLPDVVEGEPSNNCRPGTRTSATASSAAGRSSPASASRWGSPWLTSTATASPTSPWIAGAPTRCSGTRTAATARRGPHTP